MMNSSFYSNNHRGYDRPYQRQYRTQERYERSCPPRQSYSLFLIHGNTVQASATKLSSVIEVETLIRGCPNHPCDMLVHRTGRLAAVLTYTSRSEAVAASVYFWKRRLEGSHSLSTKLNPQAVPDSVEFSYEQRQIAIVFSEHVNILLESDPVVKLCKEKIDKIGLEVIRASQLLKEKNKFAVFAELQERKKRLEIELYQVENRLGEFEEAMDCILDCLSDDMKGVEKEGKARIFKLGKELDFQQLHSIILRECRRLHDGLPVYGRRREIINHIFSNQVMILIGETGSGKSTQMVQYIVDAGLASGSIVCTQPRKIAAITLAQRVAEESNGCNIDKNSIVSYPSVSSKNNFDKSNVIFTTDHCFLQDCMNGTALNTASYILVDEAHERSLNTDLLLTLIKKKLLERMDLRLIIMSATADSSKLSEYFYGCETFHVFGRNFPVDIIYVPSTLLRESGFFGTYVSDVIKMVGTVHRREAEGDILAFLTSQIEVEHACETFADPNCVALPMHGKLSAEEQSQVFKNYPGKRKIIFSTNIAETALTIKGVKFVIDSGMVKESRFQPKNGMNVLKVDWITQSSANQRAGRAGRTSPGKCFRLYSEADYHAMEVHQEPEIRKVHLGTAVLRVLSLGVRNVRDFEFVDAPSSEAIEMAIKNLVQLGAIISLDDGYGLTGTGRSLVKLGIEPRLGKIILDSFECGLKKEGLVLAAVMANASSIFCRVGTVQEKSKADCLKVPFCHPDGDLFTLLTVYKKWETEESESRNKWCWKNSINAKSMRRCNETVKELEQCLKHETNTIVPSYWTWDPDKRTSHDKSLKRIILSCLTENLAVFSGHERLGFQVALTGQNVQLHPSCSLLVYDKSPDWVAFGEILSAPNQYLVCVTALDRDDLSDVVNVNPDFDLQKLESYKLQAKTFNRVASIVLRRFCGKCCQNLNRLVSQVRKTLNDERISIEVDFEAGEIEIFSMEKDIESVSSVLTDAISREERWIKDECWERALYPVQNGQGSPPQFALLGSGGVIKHLELEKRYLTVEIHHPHAQNLVEKDLLSFIDENLSGGIVTVHRQINAPDPSRWGRVTFLTPEKAENAVHFLNGSNFDGADLKAVPARLSAANNYASRFPAVRARVSWPRRPIRGVAILKCCKGEALLVIQDMFTLAIGDKYVDCSVSTKEEDAIFVTGIPRHVPESEIHSAFRNSTDRRLLDIKLLRGNVAEDQPSEAACKDALVREIKEFMPDKNFPERNFRVEVFKPEANDYTMKAAITFDGSLHLEAAKALDRLEGSVLPGCQPWQTILCQHVFHSSLICPARVYHVVKDRVGQVLHRFQFQKGVSYNVERTESGMYRVKLIANATKIIADLRRPLEQLIKGKTLVLNELGLPGSIVNLILSRDGFASIRQIERETGTYILYDRQSSNVKIFGSTEKIEITEKKLVSSLTQLHENKLLEIRLKGRGLPTNLMKEVIERFGPDLGELKEIAPASDLSLNTKRHSLFVRGPEEDKQQIEEVIADVIASVGSVNGTIEQSTSDSSCPICLCGLEDPYKLESCGHKFCRNCLIDQFETSMRSRDNFPLCCLKEGCKTLILLHDLKSLLSIAKLDELFRASLDYFVATNSATYRFCPTPDCPSVYKSSDDSSDEKPFLCGACLTETCTRCHLEYHPFVTCEQYKEYKADPDLSLIEWRKGKDDVRNCPSQCGFIIEKTDGCDHVKCKCEKHVCWACMNYFESDTACYSHIHSTHQAY